MNILFISDIHANYQALNALKEDIESADRVLCLGDIVGYHSEVNEVIDYLRSLSHLICILGNHDAFMLQGCPPTLSSHVKYWIDYANYVIRPDNRKWLSALPLTWAGYLENWTYLLTHGSPWNPLSDYLYADNPKLHQLDTFNYDVISFGQTHRTFIKEDKKPILINPGSIGQSRDRHGFACALAFNTKEQTFRRIEREFTRLTLNE